MIFQVAKFCHQVLLSGNFKCIHQLTQVIPENCYNCLKDIHYNNHNGREYDCENSCFQYVCQNIFRYATEIYRALQVLKLEKCQKEINICSIGCGPCTELVAFEEFIANKKLSINYTFDGFDYNANWSPIQDFIKRSSSDSSKINFHQESAFKFYKGYDSKPNLIILNYVLSSVLTKDIGYFENFKKELLALILNTNSCVIIINDINLGLTEKNPRYHYDEILDSLNKAKDTKVTFRQLHFQDTVKNYMHYGEQYPSSDILWEIPDFILQNHYPNSECHSAQLIICVKKDDYKC